jgi:hypothetical protein
LSSCYETVCKWGVVADDRCFNRDIEELVSYFKADPIETWQSAVCIPSIHPDRRF